MVFYKMGVSFPIGASIVGFYGKASHLLLPMDLNRRFFCSPLAFTNTMRRIGSCLNLIYMPSDCATSDVLRGFQGSL